MSDMRQQAPATGTTRVPQQRGKEAPPEPTAWAGWVLFGAMMMILLGALHAIAGLVALFNTGYYVVPSANLVVSVDYTAWGWAHLILGVVALAAGFGLFTGQMWARVLGIGVAVISAIANFVFIPAFPLWCMTMLVLDVLVIYAIAAHGRELQNQM
jgi:hypothetical protein